MRLYLLAMESEAKDIINSYKLVQDKPFKLYKNDYNLLAITGIGKVNSAFVLTYVTQHFDITEVVNLGFVGAFGNYQIGDNIFVEEAVYHDFNLTVFGYKHGEVPNIKEDLKPDFNYYNKLKNYFRGSKLYTGDSFQESKIDDNFIVDMEATALFHVCFLLGLKIVSIKTVSDVIGLNSNLEEYKNFEEVGSKNIFELYNKIEELLKWLRV